MQPVHKHLLKCLHVPVCAPSLNPWTHMTVCSFRVLFFAFCCHLLQQQVVIVRILKVRLVINNTNFDQLWEILEQRAWNPWRCCSVHFFHPRGRVVRLVLWKRSLLAVEEGSSLCAPPTHSWKPWKTFPPSLCSYESKRMSSFKVLVGGARWLRSLEWLIQPLVRVFSRPAPLWLFQCLQRRLGNRMQISGQTSQLLFILSHAHEPDGAVALTNDMTVVKLNSGSLKGTFWHNSFPRFASPSLFLEPIYKRAVVKVQPRQNGTPNNTSTTSYIIIQLWFNSSMCATFWLLHLRDLQSVFWKNKTWKSIKIW